MMSSFGNQICRRALSSRLRIGITVALATAAMLVAAMLGFRLSRAWQRNSAAFSRDQLTTGAVVTDTDAVLMPASGGARNDGPGFELAVETIGSSAGHSDPITPSGSRESEARSRRH